MTRTIFTQEFKRSFVQSVLVLFPFFFSLMAIERLMAYRPQVAEAFGGTSDAVVDMLMSALLIVSAFVFGIGAFYRITDRHIGFVHSLPAPRHQVWTAILCANFAAILSTTPLVLILRPSLWTRTDVWAVGNSWPFALGIYLVLFAAGCCFVMMFRGVTLTATVGGLVAIFSLLDTAVLAGVPNASIDDIRVYGIFLSNRPDPAVWLLCTMGLAVLYLGLSLRFFVTGEFRLRKTRIKNWSLIAIVLAAYPLIASAGVESSLFRNATDFTALAGVSYDGKYLGIMERPGYRSLFGKISFVDVATGALAGRYESYGLVTAAWAPSEPALNVVAVESPLHRLGYALPPSDSILRLSPLGREIGRVRFGFSELKEVRSGPENRMVALTQNSRQAKVFAVGPGGQTAQLLEFPTPHTAIVHATGESTVIIASYAETFNPSPLDMTVERAWKVDASSQAHELSLRTTPRASSGFHFAIGDRLYSEDAAIIELQKRFPLPAASAYYVPLSDTYWRGVRFSSLAGRFQRFPPVRSVDEDHLFGLTIDSQSGLGRLILFDRARGSWRTLGETLPLNAQLRNPSSELRRAGAIVSSANVGGASVYPAGRLALFYATRDETRNIYLYDGNIDKAFLLASVPLSSSPFCTGVQKVDGLDGFLVSCSVGGFIYNPGHEAKAVTLPKGFPLYMTADGTFIYARAGRIFHSSSETRERQLWPLQ